VYIEKELASVREGLNYAVELQRKRLEAGSSSYDTDIKHAEMVWKVYILTPSLLLAIFLIALIKVANPPLPQGFIGFKVQVELPNSLFQSIEAHGKGKELNID